jgi:hypothetical protein
MSGQGGSGKFEFGAEYSTAPVSAEEIRHIIREELAMTRTPADLSTDAGLEGMRRDI